MGLYTFSKGPEKPGYVIGNSSPCEETALVDHEDGQGEKRPYPKSVFFIVSNEFCERFSYYGMKAILTIYLINYLSYSQNNATMIYHIFSMACYFTPLIGAIISDSFLGKFRTIFYISIIYALGNIVLSVSAVPNVGVASAMPLTMLGLALIAFGTGGIKPCVAAFGGDQFGAGQEKQLERFFSLFYISINAGSLLSTFITPVLRADVKCFGGECFTLAFGIPAGLMIVALIIFVIGKPLYKMNPPEGNIVVEVMSCIGHALINKSKDTQRKDHWLDYADDKYDKKLIEDVKAVLKVLFLYLPLPFFWALFDQQGSRWTIQAIYMDGRVTKDFRIQPDQMQVINPLLIVACIPIFQFVFYPLLSKLRIIRTPLQKMTAGGILAALAFVLAFIVELKLEDATPSLPKDGYGHLNLINGMPYDCKLNVTWAGSSYIVEPKNIEIFGQVRNSKEDPETFFFETFDCANMTEPAWLNATVPYNVTFPIASEDVESVSTLFVGQGDKDLFQFLQVDDSLAKPKKAGSDVRVIDTIPNAVNKSYSLQYEEADPYKMTRTHSGAVSYTAYVNVDPKSSYSLKLNDKRIMSNLDLRPGGRYLIYLDQDTNGKMFTTVKPNSVSLFWQIPQYIVLTFGEIMFSITGLEFSYSQAPQSMKSVVQAGWLMTVAFGNLIVVLVASFSLLSQAYEFLLFAGLMVLDMIIFAVMAYFYKPVPVKQIQPVPDLTEKPRLANGNEKGQDNPAYNSDVTTSM